MSDDRFAILDPAAGISGDMLLGALVAAGAPTEWLRGVPSRLGVPQVTVDVEWVDRCGIRACKVNVRLAGGEVERPSEPHSHPSSTSAAHSPHQQSHDLHAGAGF